jgi:hypothetical protein
VEDHFAGHAVFVAEPQPVGRFLPGARLGRIGHDDVRPDDFAQCARARGMRHIGQRRARGLREIDHSGNAARLQTCDQGLAFRDIHA